MLARVMSGGQTGADQAGSRAARASRIATGGRMPAGFLTEEGPGTSSPRCSGPWSCRGGGYPERTRANARDSDGTVWFGDPAAPGGRATLRACAGLGKAVLDFPTNHEHRVNGCVLSAGVKNPSVSCRAGLGRRPMGDRVANGSARGGYGSLAG